jgi:hypothetical protein
MEWQQSDFFATWQYMSMKAGHKRTCKASTWTRICITVSNMGMGTSLIINNSLRSSASLG